MRFYDPLGSGDTKALNAPVKAVIDIGSNSVRLVIYGGPVRAPLVTFNEKVMAGLGKDFANTGMLATDASTLALSAIERFLIVARAAGAVEPLVVATAAVREARNGQDFVRAAEKLGAAVRVLSGSEEGMMAGMGVLAGIPGADGIAADLGGGSLELVNVTDDNVFDPVSFPLGVLRVPEMRKQGRRAFRRELNRMIDASQWTVNGKGRPLYLVGGSFRALAKFDMMSDAPVLGAIHQYAMKPARADVIERQLIEMKPDQLSKLADVTSARREHLPAAAALLSVLVARLQPSRLIISSTGLREGLLYDGLSPLERAQDPLIEAARYEGALESRFPEHGEALDAWIAPLFDDKPDMARLRLAASHLADVGWRANPDYRADRAVETALHGNWIGIDARGRAILSQAMNSVFRGNSDLVATLSPFAKASEFERAQQWGSALRLAQRLSGGNGDLLKATQLRVEEKELVLQLDERVQGLYGEVVERRHKQLASLMKLNPKFSVK